MASSATQPRGVLVPLYAGFVTAQALDVVATRRAVDRGAVEINPLLAPLAGNSFALAAVKGTQAAGTIWLVERLRHKNRTAAIALMIGLNAGYTVIVVRNLRYPR